MSIDFTHFTPGAALVGGPIIGLVAAMLVLGTGRIAGIGGIVGGLLLRPHDDMDQRTAFLIGLVRAPMVAALLGHPMIPEIATGWSEAPVARFLVGVRTRYTGDRTSNHDMCGLSCGSMRLLVTTLSFVTAGIVTVFVVWHMLGG